MSKVALYGGISELRNYYSGQQCACAGVTSTIFAFIRVEPCSGRWTIKTSVFICVYLCIEYFICMYLRIITMNIRECLNTAIQMKGITEANLMLFVRSNTEHYSSCSSPSSFVQTSFPMILNLATDRAPRFLR